MTDQHKDIIIQSFIEAHANKEKRAGFMERILKKLLSTNPHSGVK